VVATLCVAALALYPRPAIANATNCGASISDLYLEGESQNGHTVVYSFRFHSHDQKPVSAELTLTDHQGHVYPLTVPQFTPTGVDPISDLIRFAWTNDKIATASLVSTKTSSATLQCASSPIQLHPLEDGGSTLSFPDLISAASDAGPRTAEPSAPPFFSDAVFIKKVMPNYPPEAKNIGITGDVRILAIVTPDGKPNGIYVDSSSQDYFLDGAAADAASASTFRPARRLGVPVPRAYPILYAFRLYPSPGGHPRSTACGVRLDRFLIDGFDRESNSLLYALKFVADRNDVQSVSLEFDNAVHATLTFAADDWTKLDSGAYEANRSVLLGTLVGAAALNSVSNHASVVTPCARVVASAWDNTYGMLHSSDVQRLSKIQSSVHGVTEVGAARFEHRVWATYPPGALTIQPESSAVVLITVGDGSKASSVKLVGSTGVAALDDAAVAAAKASTYRHEGSTPAMYEAWYSFDPHVPGLP